MTVLSDALQGRYRAAQLVLTDAVKSRIAALYGEAVNGDDLDGSFAVFIAQAAGLVQAGQANGVALAVAYLEALIALEGGRASRLTAFDSGVVGISAAGVPLAEAMAPFPSMVKGQIGKGAELAAALAFGRFLAERFSDAEVTGAVDRHTEVVTEQSGEFRGWEGVVSPKSCDRCRSRNSGFHPLNDPIYRHGACNCTKRYVVA